MNSPISLDPINYYQNKQLLKRLADNKHFPKGATQDLSNFIGYKNCYQLDQFGKPRQVGGINIPSHWRNKTYIPN
eukprot:Pgem_evm6s2062